jgi:hypothetical protein
MENTTENTIKISILIASLPMIILASSLIPSQINLIQELFAQGVENSAEPSGQQIVQQGIATSSPDPLPGHEAHQSITILRLRDDNAVYSGRITFTTTQPVEVQILHRDMSHAAATGVIPDIPEKFGKLAIIELPGGNGQVTITNVVPKFTEGATGNTFAASVPFSGNAVALHNLEGKPFAASYTATADVLGPATRADDIEPQGQQEQQSTEGQQEQQSTEGQQEQQSTEGQQEQQSTEGQQ